MPSDAFSGKSLRRRFGGFSDSDIVTPETPSAVFVRIIQCEAEQ